MLRYSTAIGNDWSPLYTSSMVLLLPLLEMTGLPFIDHVFFIWMHGEERLKSVINHLNSSHETITFTSEHSQDNISFLDVQVSVGEGAVLSTDFVLQAN